MKGGERAPIDAEAIRQAYMAGLDVWGYSYNPPKPEELAQLRDQLTEYAHLLFPEVKGLWPRMRSETRQAAFHALRHAHYRMQEPVTTNSVLAETWNIQDLAVVVRALLILYEKPGPLGAPIGRNEIEEALRQRECGSCLQPIADGEGYERAVYASDAGPCIRGYRHTDSCVPLADERRVQLRAVP
ncbi:DUF6415 family natural product biosynthesis protein [Streptomyces bicolor]|uniref:DUF6415 family natural product biosynthesis protein n=1 Tax=Streptomyces bicolor TaxID=66874 RepID=UPI0004E19A58|nr:DUF6415 family natural product biosynthesis protein [Streptomyces bicolor]